MAQKTNSFEKSWQELKRRKVFRVTLPPVKARYGLSTYCYCPCRANNKEGIQFSGSP